MAMMIWPLMAMVASAQERAGKIITFESLAKVIVPGELLLGTVSFQGDYGADFGAYDLRLDHGATSDGVKLLGWSRVQMSGENRIVLRFITDARLQPGTAFAGIVVTDDTGQEAYLTMRFNVALPLPAEFYRAARKVAIGNVPLYSAQQVDGRTQALQNFQANRKSARPVAETYISTLKAAGWTVANQSVGQSSAQLEMYRGDAKAVVNIYADPLTGDLWATVGVTQ